MAKFITEAEAAELFFDGCCVVGACFGSEGWPEMIGKAIEKRFLETGHPAGMIAVHAAGNRAANCWAHEGLLSLDISSHESTTPKIAKRSKMTNFLAGICLWAQCSRCTRRSAEVCRVY